MVSMNQIPLVRRVVGLAVLAALLVLFAAAVVSADGLEALLTRLHIVESATSLPADTFGSQRAEDPPLLLVPPPVEGTTGGTPPPPDLGSRQMSPEEAQSFFPFPLYYPSYVPAGMHLAYIESLPLTTQRAVVVLEDATPSSPASQKARVSIFQRPIQAGDGDLQSDVRSRYSIPGGSGRVVQVAGTEALYVEAVWRGDPPRQDDRFHQLIFQRDGMRFFLYAPRERVPLPELIRMAESLRRGRE